MLSYSKGTTYSDRKGKNAVAFASMFFPFFFPRWVLGSLKYSIFLHYKQKSCNNNEEEEAEEEEEEEEEAEQGDRR